MKKEIKKTKKTKLPLPGEVTFSEPVSKKLLISPIDIDLGRGDLNLLRDKINEVINKLND